MKSKKAIAVICALAAVMTAGSSFAVFAADDAKPAENSTGISAQQDSSENTETAKPERKHKRSTSESDTAAEGTESAKPERKHKKSTSENDAAADEADSSVKRRHRRSRKASKTTDNFAENSASAEGTSV